MLYCWLLVFWNLFSSVIGYIECRWLVSVWFLCLSVLLIWVISLLKLSWLCVVRCFLC